MRTLRWGRPRRVALPSTGETKIRGQTLVMNPQDGKGKDQVLHAPERRGLGWPAEHGSPARLLGGGADLGRE